MRFWARKDVMSRLRLSQSASYRIVGTARGHLVSSADILAILNNSRRGPQPMLTAIPSDLATADEMAQAIDGNVSAHDLHNWTLRTNNVVPHFLLNTHSRRFQKSAVLAWLDHLSQIVRRG